MSKSTPISNLPNLKKQSGQAFEQRENEIVKEILNEIDNEAPKAPPAPPQPSPEELAQRQAMIQQQMMEQQMMEQQMMEQQMMEQQMAAASANSAAKPQLNNVENIVAKNEEKSFFDDLLEKLKPSIVVGVIVALLSLPFVGDMISKIVNSKESLRKMALPLTLVIKALLGSALFFGSSEALNA